jgi:hypothetical protein
LTTVPQKDIKKHYTNTYSPRSRGCNVPELFGRLLGASSHERSMPGAAPRAGDGPGRQSRGTPGAGPPPPAPAAPAGRGSALPPPGAAGAGRHVSRTAATSHGRHRPSRPGRGAPGRLALTATARLPHRSYPHGGHARPHPRGGPRQERTRRTTQHQMASVRPTPLNMRHVHPSVEVALKGV